MVCDRPVYPAKKLTPFEDYTDHSWHEFYDNNPRSPSNGEAHSIEPPYGQDNTGVDITSGTIHNRVSEDESQLDTEVHLRDGNSSVRCDDNATIEKARPRQERQVLCYVCGDVLLTDNAVQCLSWDEMFCLRVL